MARSSLPLSLRQAGGRVFCTPFLPIGLGSYPKNKWKIAAEVSSRLIHWNAHCRPFMHACCAPLMPYGLSSDPPPLCSCLPVKTSQNPPSAFPSGETVKSGGMCLLPAHLPHIPKCVHATRDFVAKSRNVALQKTFLKFNSLHVSGIVSAMTLRGRLFRTASPDA